MALVVLPRSLINAFGIEPEQTVYASNVRSLIRHLESQRPGIAAEIEKTMSIAIDGEIYSDAMLEELAEDTEVHFIPRLQGG